MDRPFTLLRRWHFWPGLCHSHWWGLAVLLLSLSLGCFLALDEGQAFPHELSSGTWAIWGGSSTESCSEWGLWGFMPVVMGSCSCVWELRLSHSLVCVGDETFLMFGHIRENAVWILHWTSQGLIETWKRHSIQIFFLFPFFLSEFWLVSWKMRILILKKNTKQVSGP